MMEKIEVYIGWHLGYLQPLGSWIIGLTERPAFGIAERDTSSSHPEGLALLYMVLLEVLRLGKDSDAAFLALREILFGTPMEHRLFSRCIKVAHLYK